MSAIKGNISQVIGPVVDVNFEKGVSLPNIYDALEVFKTDGTRVVLEVQSHVGENSVRTISMDSTDGFRRGMEVTTTGSAIKMPIGDQIKGRLFNVVGEAIDLPVILAPLPVIVRFLVLLVVSPVVLTILVVKLPQSKAHTKSYEGYA